MVAKLSPKLFQTSKPFTKLIYLHHSDQTQFFGDHLSKMTAISEYLERTLNSVKCPFKM